MYQKYQTEALVIGSREHGEADRVFTLYTRDFGRVIARAIGVRRESSRMRYALSSGSLAYVGLVHGKRGWRLAGALSRRHLPGRERGAAAFARVSLLIARLVQGQEENRYLFDALAAAHQALASASRDAVPLIELVTVARVLYALGYLSSEAVGSALFVDTELRGPELTVIDRERERLLGEINRAIAETQL